VALAANALVTMAEARTVLGISGSTSDADVETMINRASDEAEHVRCMRPLKQRVITTLRVEGRCGPWLYPEWYEGAAWPIDPVASVPVVIVDGVTQTLWKSEADGDPATKDVSVYPDHFYRALGWAPTGTTSRNVVLTYSGGYNPVPEDLKVAVLELIAKRWGPLQEQRPDFASMAGPGGSLQTLDGQWSGQSGSGGVWSLSRTSKEIFELYRRKGSC
jgi:hypothetical protein